MRRLPASTLVVVGLAVATLAFAQGKKPARGKPAAKPKPAAAVTPAKPSEGAGGANPYEGDQPASEPAPASSGAPADAPEKAPVEVVAPPSGAGDGGVKNSPLNPRPEEFPDGGGQVTTSADLEKVLGEIAVLRARVAAIGDTLFHSRIVIKVAAGGHHAKIGKLAVRLDEGVVYSSPPNFQAEDEVTIYDHAVAPGRHILGIDLDRRDDRAEAYRTGQKDRFSLEVPEGQRLETVIWVDDDSDMASDFPSSQKGKYDLRVRVRARAAR
jgi:hypothetical protein